MKYIRALDAPHKRASHLSPEHQEMLHALESDWRNMTGTETEFGTGRFDPALLDRALPNAFVLHRVAAGVVRTRVAGQRLHDMLRMDPRGMPFTSFFTDAARDSALRMAELTLDTPAIVGLPLVSPRGIGRRNLRAEALLMPMRDAQGDLTRIMGAIVTSGHIGMKSHRFDIATDQPLRCDPLTLPFPNRRLRRGPHAGMADAPTEKAQPGLRLVVNNT